MLKDKSKNGIFPSKEVTQNESLKNRGRLRTKSFEGLKKDVIDKGLCSMCRGCVTFCSASTLEAISIIKDKPDYVNIDNCLTCGICYSICPNTTPLEKNLKVKYGYSLPIGSYKEAYSLRSTDLQIQEVCTDGGFGTGFLKYLIDEKIVDSALISRKEGIWRSQPFIAMSYKYLLKGAGSSLSISSSLEDLDIYTTYIPSLLALKGMGQFPTKLAVVGTPCQIKTIRKMQLLKIVPSNIVGFTVGLFCYENFHFTEESRKKFESLIDSDISNVRKINVKESLIVTLMNGEIKYIDLDELADIVRTECNPCTDFTNWAADVSIGGIGSKEGYTTILARTAEVKDLIERSVNKGYFTRNDDFDKKETLKIIEKMASRKYKRGKKRLKELGIDTENVCI